MYYSDWTELKIEAYRLYKRMAIISVIFWKESRDKIFMQKFSILRNSSFIEAYPLKKSLS